MKELQSAHEYGVDYSAEYKLSIQNFKHIMTF